MEAKTVGEKEMIRVYTMILTPLLLYSVNVLGYSLAGTIIGQEYFSYIQPQTPPWLKISDQPQGVLLRYTRNSHKTESFIWSRR